MVGLNAESKEERTINARKMHKSTRAVREHTVSEIKLARKRRKELLRQEKFEMKNRSATDALRGQPAQKGARKTIARTTTGS